MLGSAFAFFRPLIPVFIILPVVIVLLAIIIVVARVLEVQLRRSNDRLALAVNFNAVLIEVSLSL